MPVLDSPAFFDWPVSPLGQKRYGYLVWLRLDPEASVRQLEDEEASRAAALLPRDWFLGFIIAGGGAGQRNPEGKVALSFALALIGEGPPDPEGHSVPISPAIQIPDDRVPLQLSSPLPWPNLYVHSQVMAGGIISRLHHGTGQFEPVLTEANISLVYHAIFADFTARQNAQAQALRAAAGGDSEYGSDSDAEGTEYDTESDADVVEYDTRPVDDKFKRLRMHVELWMDPSAFPGPPTRPENWLDVGKRMSAIWGAWRDRGYEELKTRGARKAEAWLQSVEAGAPIPDDGNEIALDPRASDDAIVPEDAVDYRIEQERARDPSPVSWPDDWPVNLSQPKHLADHVSFHPPLMLPALTFTGDQAAPPSTVHHDPGSTRASAEPTRGERAHAVETARPAADVDAPVQRDERENDPGRLLREDVSPDDAVDDRMEQCREEAFGQRDTPSPAQQKVLYDRERTGSCSPRDTPGSAKPAAVPISAPQVVDETAYPQARGGRAAPASGKDFLRGSASAVRSLLARVKQRTRSLRIPGARLTGTQHIGKAPSK